MKFTKKIPALSPAFRKKMERSLVLAADWLVRNQVTDTWPAWNANKGRYPYHTLIDPRTRAAKPRVLSTCWKTARAAQGMYSAWLVTGKEAFRSSADLAMQYVMTLQVLDPQLKGFVGTFREDSPMGPHVAIRDGVEAVQGLINGYLVNGNPIMLERARLGTDWFLANFNSRDFPSGIGYPEKGTFRRTDDQMAWCFYAGAIIFCQMEALTGRKAYIDRGAIPMMDHILRRHILPSGALGFPKGLTKKTHHVADRGELKNVIVNDDGIGEALLCTYRACGSRRYLDAAAAMGEFWLKTTAAPELLAANPCIALFLLDLYRLTGDKKYVPVIENLLAATVDLQLKAPRDPEIHGAFIGEDMARHYDKRTKPRDYVDLRITSYALIALAKAAAEKPAQWGCAYSVFGW